MAFRKQMALALAMALLTICFGCADELNAPNPGDEAPVLPPTNIVATALSGGNVEVLWGASSQPDINGYNLYRREVGNGNPKRLNPNRIMSTDFRDYTSQAGREYEYRLTAVSDRGKESRHISVVIRTHLLLEDGDGRVAPRSRDEN